MSWTHIASVSGEAGGTGTTLDITTALNIQAGDALIVMAGWDGGDSVATVIETDEATNPCTMLTMAAGTGNTRLRMGYILSAEADAEAYFRLKLTTGRSYRKFIVMQFRPDAGDTVSYDTGETPANGASAAPQTGNFSTSGSDEVVAAFCYLYSGRTASSQLIADAAADGVTDIGSEGHGWYKLFTATQSSIHAQATLNSSDTFVIDEVALKATAGGGGSVVPKIMLMHDQFNGGL